MLSDGGGLRGILCCNCNNTKSVANDCLSKGDTRRGCMCARVTTDCTCTNRTKFAKYGCRSLMGTNIVTCVSRLFTVRRPPGKRVSLSGASMGTIQGKGMRGAPSVALSKSRQGCVSIRMPGSVAVCGGAGKASTRGNTLGVCNKSAFCLATPVLRAKACSSKRLRNSMKRA